MDSDNLEEYELFGKLTFAAFETLTQNGIKSKDGDEVGFKLEKQMNAKQGHAFNLYSTYSRIRRSVKQIATIIRLLEIEPSIYLTNASKTKYSEYLEFNLENYYLRITSILDQSIILISDFYHLGVPAKSTSLQYLNENTHTKKREAVQHLKNFNKFLQPIKHIRNKIAHRGDFKDDDIVQIEAHLYLLSMVPSDANDPFLEEMTQKVDELIEKKVAIVKDGLTETKNFLILMDKALMGDYSHVRLD